MPQNNTRLTVGNALATLKPGEEFRELLSHGTMSLEIYRPHKVDRQQPHEQDELYVVAAGSGYFVNDGARHPVEVGEVLFVAAGVPHHFENFTQDFAVWVIFYGKKGGESPRQ